MDRSQYLVPDRKAEMSEDDQVFSMVKGFDPGGPDYNPMGDALAILLVASAIAAAVTDRAEPLISAIILLTVLGSTHGRGGDNGG